MSSTNKKKTFFFSFSLFGDNEYYLKSLNYQINQILKFYKSPNFIISYCKNYRYLNKLYSLKKNKKIKIILVKKNDDHLNPFYPLFWRYEVKPLIKKKLNIYYIFRDSDCEFTCRDFYLINQWIDSNTTFCSIRDSNTEWPIMAGCFMCTNNGLNSIYKIIRKNKEKIILYGKVYYIDQLILRDIIYPKICNELLIITENYYFLSDKIIQTPLISRKNIINGFTKDYYSYWLNPNKLKFRYKKKLFGQKSNRYINNRFDSSFYKRFGQDNYLQKKFHNYRYFIPTKKTYLCTYYNFNGFKYFYYLVIYITFQIIKKLKKQSSFKTVAQTDGDFLYKSSLIKFIESKLNFLKK